jgi:hypothetical protein
MVRPQRWTGANIHAADAGGFVAIGDYLALERATAMLAIERAELRHAAQQVIAHMDGRQPVRGWLKDTDKSRDALAELVRVLGA